MDGEQLGQASPDREGGLNGEKLGQVDLDPERIPQIEFEIEGVPVKAVLLPRKSTDEYAVDDTESVVGVEETMDDQGDRDRKYLKIPKRLREAEHTVIKYYHNHESLVKGAAAVSVLAGVITVGTLVAKRFKKR